jgi:hypothetical protein
VSVGLLMTVMTAASLQDTNADCHRLHGVLHLYREGASLAEQVLSIRAIAGVLNGSGVNRWQGSST